MDEWDVIVVGGGAAGLSAALMLGRACRRVLVVDAGSPRNRFAAHMHGVLGMDGLSPAELVRRGREEVAAYDVKVVDGSVERLDDVRTGGLVATLGNGERHHARAAIMATGMSDQLPDVPGLAERWGVGVAGCPYCHGWEVRGQRLGVLATGPFSLHQVELIRQWSETVVFFTAALGELPEETVARLRSRGIELVEAPVLEVLGDDGAVSGARTADGLVELDALFVAPQPQLHEDALSHLGLEHADGPMGNALALDPMGRTSHPWIWAAGNVTNPGLNVPMSISSGVLAAGAVNMALIGAEFDAASGTPEAHWEARYGGTGRPIWSGKVNTTTADVAAGLPVGRALELGSGEGGDAVWLARQGWHVTAVDISATAVARGAALAEDAGVSDRITWVAHNLDTWRTEESFDLVTASFFHSEVDLPRTEILRRAAGTIAPGGHLLIVSHAAFPPWAKAHEHTDPRWLEHRFLSPAEEVAELGLPPEQWETVLAETRQREATGPDGEPATLDDGVVLLRRR